jgi:hypothetical protein
MLTRPRRRKRCGLPVSRWSSNAAEPQGDQKLTTEGTEKSGDLKSVVAVVSVSSVVILLFAAREDVDA